jgi:hypothetical protein
MAHGDAARVIGEASARQERISEVRALEPGRLSAPPVLATVFGVGALERNPSTIVAIDPGGTILWTNSAWARFARDNGGAAMLERFGPGSSYFEGISGPLREHFEQAFQRAFRASAIFEQDYECSSPDVFRLMHLRALPIAGGALLLEHSLVTECAHTRTCMEELDVRYRGDHGIVVQCSNCRRVRRADGSAWDWVRPWVAASPPETSHGICTTCVDYYYGRRFRDDDGAGPGCAADG